MTIVDNGLGMNQEDLEKNLSTIAKSGTKEFLKMSKIQKSNWTIWSWFLFGIFGSK